MTKLFPDGVFVAFGNSLKDQNYPFFHFQYLPDDYLLGSKSTFNPDIPIQDQADCIAYDDKWEFPRERLNFGKTQ